MPGAKAAFPPDLYRSSCRRLALQDTLTRLFGRQAMRFSFQAKGSGHSGLISISRCGQEVLERTACRVDPTNGSILLRLEVGFPANGRIVNARELEKFFLTICPSVRDLLCCIPIWRLIGCRKRRTWRGSSIFGRCSQRWAFEPLMQVKAYCRVNPAFLPGP